MLRHLIVISAVLVIGLGVSGPAASETTSDSVNLPREQALARQVKALKARNAQLRRQVKTLNRRVRTLRDRWADARREGALTQEVLQDTSKQLAEAQKGAMQAISTMPPGSIWPYLPTIADRFNSPAYEPFFSSSHDTLGNEYQSESWTFGYCDFCTDPSARVQPLSVHGSRSERRAAVGREAVSEPGT